MKMIACKKLIFFYALIFASPLWATNNIAFSKVALAIASPGPGASIMGHAFILFLNNKNKKSESIAVQYNLSDLSTKEKQSNASSLTAVSDFLGYTKKFKVQFMPGLDMINRYRLANRSILLYYLKLDPSQIKKLWELLSEDKTHREKNETKDYSFLDNNCLTMSLQALNEVIPDSNLHFTFFDRKNSSQSYFLRSFALPVYIKNSPFIIPKNLPRHPLIEGTEILKPALVDAAPIYTELYHLATEFGSLCIDSESYTKNMYSMLGQAKIRESKSFLDYLKSAKDKCSSDLGQQKYQQIINIIYMLAPDLDSKIKIEGYKQ
ncbi:MAG: DUF4105 domain-containing protein [Pseudobdellovibrionaceae bacterium]